MKRFINIAVHNPVFVNILMAMVLLAGLASSTMLIREVLPAFALDMILVQVPYPGAGPDEVEEGVSIKLEDAIEGIDGIKNYYSTAAENVAVMRIEVQTDADVSEVKDEVTDRINSVRSLLPVDVEDPIISELKIDSKVLSIAVFGDAGEGQMKELAESIKDDLLTRNGISQVSISGAREYEISIEVSEEKLRRYGLTLDQISQVVRNASQNFPAGTLRGSGDQIKIRTMGRRYTGRQYAEIVLMAKADGTSIRLSDVATIRDGFEDDEIEARFNGQRAVMVDVSKTKTEDSLKIAKSVNTYVAERNIQLPPNIQLQTFFDNSRFINERLTLLINNGLMGLAIVFGLLWLFLDFRLAFWCSMGIPISLAGALALMHASGMTINMLTLFALIMILGIIVDDAIVVGESIYHKRRQGMPPLRAAVEGGTEVAWPVFGAVVTTIFAFLPLIFVGGIMGKFIRQLPIVVICALTVSLLESIFMMPSHLSNLPPSHDAARRTQGFMGRLRRFRHAFGDGLETVAARYYHPVIRFLLGWRYVVFGVAVTLLLLAAGMIRAGIIKYQLFPEVDTDLAYAQVEFPIGTPLETTDRALASLLDHLNGISAEFQKARGDSLVQGVYALSGQGYGANENEMVKGSHLGLMQVELLPTELRRWHFREILNDWERSIGKVPGAVSTVFRSPSMGPGGKDLEIALLGHDLNELKSASVALQTKLLGYQGVSQVEDNFREGKTELRARLRPEARNLGLNEADLGRQLRYGFYGNEALRVQRGREDLKVWIRYPLAERRSLGDVDALRIQTPAGHEVPVTSVADMELEQGYFTIFRKNGERRIAITGEVDSAVANAEEITVDLEENYGPELMQRFPGVRVNFEGQRKDSAEALSSLVIGFPLAMLAIYLLLATMFRSYVQPLVIMITIPFGLIGAVLGHLAMGFQLTMLSMFGMVALSGIVVNDAIVLIEAINERIKRGVPVREAIGRAGVRRFRAIMLTTLTTSLGLAPLILEKSMQAQFLIPMAISIAAGVAFATLLTLLLIPCLMLILNDLRRMAHQLNTGEYPTRESVEPMLQLPPEERPHVPIP